MIQLGCGYVTRVFRRGSLSLKTSPPTQEAPGRQLTAKEVRLPVVLRGEGWKLLKAAYDDGGISGATMERPALQRLLDDIDHGLIDVVVVYKVDRLTRSLTDFAKMVEIFDGHGVSFVAVTQQFNTTTSMGRLTLNVLLSFAQFKREVTGERIRDKIAASKRKGLWMGGVAPLGYDLRDRALVVKEAEACPSCPGCRRVSTGFMFMRRTTAAPE
jgi:DNA invertase Pin-like site-specific DNA recombinase